MKKPEGKCSARLTFLEPYQRPKLSDPAHGTQRLQPEREGRVRCSARLCENSPRGILENEKGVRITFTENKNAPERNCERRFFCEPSPRGVFTQPRAWLGRW